MRSAHGWFWVNDLTELVGDSQWPGPFAFRTRLLNSGSQRIAAGAALLAELLFVLGGELALDALSFGEERLFLRSKTGFELVLRSHGSR